MIQINRDILPFSAINEPPPAIRTLWELHSPPATIKYASPLANGCHIFSREAAIALSQCHPLIVTENNHHCICNQRILEILTTRLNPDDKIPVGIIPADTDNDLIVQFALADILLSAMTYASVLPAKDIFYLSQSLPKSLTEKMTPALTDTIPTSAAVLGTVTGTIYKWLKDLKLNLPR